MLKKLLTITTIVLAFTQAKAQFSDYGAVDNFFMANPDLVNRAQYAGRSVNPNYLLVNWDQQSDMGQRMISNGFVRLGISSWEDHSQYGLAFLNGIWLSPMLELSEQILLFTHQGAAMTMVLRSSTRFRSMLKKAAMK
jgi:hypothetical protein